MAKIKPQILMKLFFITSEIVTTSTMMTIIHEFSNVFLILFFRVLFHFGEKYITNKLKQRKQAKNGIL